jgi:hypothetical protein
VRKLIVLAVMAFAFAACAKKQHVGDLDLSAKVSIAVVNNFIPVDQFTIYMVNANGGQLLLGTASPNRTQKFTYQPTTATDKFTLVAQATNGRRLSSQQFTLQNLESVTWDLRSNMIQFYEP